MVGAKLESFRWADGVGVAGARDAVRHFHVTFTVAESDYPVFRVQADLAVTETGSSAHSDAAGNGGQLNVEPCV